MERKIHSFPLQKNVNNYFQHIHFFEWAHTLKRSLSDNLRVSLLEERQEQGPVNWLLIHANVFKICKIRFLHYGNARLFDFEKKLPVQCPKFEPRNQHLPRRTLPLSGIKNGLPRRGLVILLGDRKPLRDEQVLTATSLKNGKMEATLSLMWWLMWSDGTCTHLLESQRFECRNYPTGLSGPSHWTSRFDLSSWDTNVHLFAQLSNQRQEFGDHHLSILKYRSDYNSFLTFFNFFMKDSVGTITVHCFHERVSEGWNLIRL